MQRNQPVPTDDVMIKEKELFIKKSLIFQIFKASDGWIEKWKKSYLNACDPLRYLVPFVQFKKREKHPWRSITFSKVAG